MANVTMCTRSFVEINFRQKRSNPKYGMCLWARFLFDEANYTLQIMSDCGNYFYGWTPTHKHESFMHLCGRIEPGYLLDKISSRTAIDRKKTIENIRSLIISNGGCPDDTGIFDELREVCSCCTEHEACTEIEEVFDKWGITEYDSYDIACCIERDYPIAAKTIVDIFAEHIQPMCKEAGV